MKRLFFFWMVLLCVGAAAQPLKYSEIRAEAVHSSILGEDVYYNVYLPAGFDFDSSASYPVVYLLHGLTDTYTAWAVDGHMKEVVDELIISGEAARMIIVMPNAGGPDPHAVQNGYFNIPGHLYEDFFFKELIPYVETRFHVIPDKQHRAIMGLSMGGGGSTVYCQHHPDMFSSCYAMSAWLDNDKQWSDDPSDKLYKVCQSVHENSAIEYVRNASEDTLEQLRSVKWFFDCGDDDFILDLTLDMYKAMRERGVKAELRVRDGWHCWEYWHQSLRWSLPFASRNFGSYEY